MGVSFFLGGLRGLKQRERVKIRQIQDCERNLEPAIDLDVEPVLDQEPELDP